MTRALNPTYIWCDIIALGKTVLASLIVEECQRLCKEQPISVVYFYCKHGDSMRDSFMAVIRGILVQILRENDDLLPYLYEKASISGEPILRSPELARELLETALRSLAKVYVIIDGLDECDKNEQKKIITWFRSTIDSGPEANSESLSVSFSAKIMG